jgi:hypothetical protein
MECATHRGNLALMIRNRGGVTEEERIQLERQGVRFEPETGLVTWSPLPGEPIDASVERGHLLFAVHFLLGPPAPMTAEELVEARSCPRTFAEQLAELGVTIPRRPGTDGG